MAGTSYKGSEISDVDQFIKGDGLESSREKEIGQHIGYRYDVNLVPDYDRMTPFLSKYLEIMGWHDLNWLEDVHMGYEDGNPAVFDRNINVSNVGSPPPGAVASGLHEVLISRLVGGRKSCLSANAVNAGF